MVRAGSGTYIPDNLIDVLDNQYFKGAIELGLAGITGLVAYFVVPVLTALSARHRSRDSVYAPSPAHSPAPPSRRRCAPTPSTH